MADIARRNTAPAIAGQHESDVSGPIGVRVIAPSLGLQVHADPKLKTAYVIIEGDKREEVAIGWHDGMWTLRWPEDAGVTTIHGSGIIVGNGSIQINSFRGGRTTIITNGGMGADSPRARLFVPSGSTLIGEINAGGVTVTAPDRRSGLASATLHTQSADLTTQCPVGSIGFSSQSGDLEALGVSGPVQASTMSGDVTVSHAMGSVQASTMSGDVEVHAEESIVVAARTMSGDVRVTKEANMHPQVQASTMSGRVRKP